MNAHDDEHTALMNDAACLPGPGDIIAGRFRLERELGRGTFGVVYEARQLDLARHVALKFLQPSMLGREGIAQRFTREARLASSLNNPNAVVIYAYGTHQTEGSTTELPYIAMEFLEGEDLHAYVSRVGPLPAEEAIAILLQALRCLAQAHRLGIIHRDLKPENLFLTRDRNGDYLLKVLDFGIAKAVHGNWGTATMAGVTMAGHVVGTPSFMAPEQARGEPDLTSSVDTYAMACVAYDMLTGEAPYDGRTPMEVALNHITSPIPSVPGLEDHPIGLVLTEAMSKEAFDRFEDAAAFSSAIEQAVSASGMTPRMPRWRHEVRVDLSAASSGKWAQLTPLPGDHIPEVEQDPDESIRTQVLDTVSREFAAKVRPQPAEEGDATSMIPAISDEDVRDTLDSEAPRSNLVMILIVIAALVFLATSVALLLVVLGSMSDKGESLDEGSSKVEQTVPTSRIPVSSEPVGAKVYIGDQYLGLTPIDIEAPQDHKTLFVRLDGFNDAVRAVSPDSASIHIVLEALEPAAPEVDEEARDPEPPPGVKNNSRRRRSAHKPTLKKADPSGSSRRRGTVKPDIELWDHEK